MVSGFPNNIWMQQPAGFFATPGFSNQSVLVDQKGPRWAKLGWLMLNMKYMNYSSHWLQAI
jgi:hypothetical protein